MEVRWLPRFGVGVLGREVGRWVPVRVSERGRAVSRWSSNVVDGWKGREGGTVVV